MLYGVSSPSSNVQVQLVAKGKVTDTSILLGTYLVLMRSGGEKNKLMSEPTAMLAAQ